MKGLSGAADVMLKTKHSKIWGEDSTEINAWHTTQISQHLYSMCKLLIPVRTDTAVVVCRLIESILYHYFFIELLCVWVHCVYLHPEEAGSCSSSSFCPSSPWLKPAEAVVWGSGFGLLGSEFCCPGRRGCGPSVWSPSWTESSSWGWTICRPPRSLARRSCCSGALGSPLMCWRACAEAEPVEEMRTKNHVKEQNKFMFCKFGTYH